MPNISLADVSGLPCQISQRRGWPVATDSRYGNEVQVEQVLLCAVPLKSK